MLPFLSVSSVSSVPSVFSFLNEIIFYFSQIVILYLLSSNTLHICVGVDVIVRVGVGIAMVGVAVGVRVGVNVSVLVIVGVTVAEGVEVLVVVGIRVAVLVGALGGVTVPFTKTFDGSGRLTVEKAENPLTVLFSKRLFFERQSWGYMYCQSGLSTSLSNGINDEKLQG